MKVLFLNPIGGLGGAEQGLLDLLASLRTLSPELEIEVVALEDGLLLSEARALGASTDVFPLPNVLAALGESHTRNEESRSWSRGIRAAGSLALWLPRFAALLRRKRADVLHSNGLKTHLLAALARPPGIPLLWHLHDFISERRVSARLVPFLEGRAALGVAVSKAVAEDARTVVRRLPIVTVLNGIRIGLFVPGTATPVDLDALAGMTPAPQGTVRVGLVATYASWKGHHLFLEAVRQVRSPDARFYIVGGPVYRTVGSQVSERELRETISRFGLSNRCGLVPFQSDVARVYAALDVVAQSSTRPEPFGRTVAEAMASGCATVAFGAGGVLEQLDGTNGILVPSHETALFAQALEDLIASPSLRQRLGAEASRSAREKLDSRRLGQQFASLYASLKSAHRVA